MFDIIVGIACIVLPSFNSVFVLADDLFNISSSSTGPFDTATNVTLPLDDSLQSDGYSSGLPVSNMVAIILCCVIVLFVCICLFACAKHQMTHSLQTKRRPTINLKLQAKLEAARRGWKREGGGKATVGNALGPNATLASLAIHGASQAEINARALELQRDQMVFLAGGSMGGLGSCRYEHLRDPQDFQDEPWATLATKTSLKRSGNILDVVIVTQQVMFMATISGIIPLGIMIGLPFHKMILESLDMRDWYGDMTEVQFNLCMTIAACGTFVHLVAYILAKLIFDYDRSPSIIAEKESHRLKTLANVNRLKLQPQSPPPPVTPSSGMVTPSSTGTITPGGPLSSDTYQYSNYQHSSTRGAQLVGINTVPVASAVVVPNFTGRDPQLWPLRLFCIVTLLSYGLLGFQTYVSFDESLGRQHHLTSTNKRFWPSSAGESPIITFIICLIIGSAMMIPLGFSLRLLALFHPRKVHPNIIAKHE